MVPVGEVERLAANAHDIAPLYAATYRLRFRLALAKGAFGEAKRSSEQALKIDPNDSDAQITRAVYEIFAGEPEVGLRLLEELLEVHSTTPRSTDIIRYWKAIAEFGLGEAGTAILTLEEINGMSYMRNLLLTACLGARGELAEAAVKRFLSGGKLERRLQVALQGRRRRRRLPGLAQGERFRQTFLDELPERRGIVGHLLG